MTKNAPTYLEVMKAANEAAKDFETWPEWKKKLSEPKRVAQRPLFSKRTESPSETS